MANAFLHGQSRGGGKDTSLFFLGEVAGNRSSDTVITFNLSSLVPAGLVVDNFIVQFKYIPKTTTNVQCNFTYTYNNIARILVCTSTNSIFSGNGTADIYLAENY